MKQVAPHPKTPTGLTLISTELLGKTPERDIAAAPTKVHLKALLGDSIHKVLNLCTYNHNRDMSQATGTTMLSKFVDCFLVCKTAFKEVIENHWTILCDLSYSKCITLLEMILKKNHCAPARFLDKIIPGVPSALASMPSARSERAEMTIQAWRVLCFLSLTHLYWHYSCLPDPFCNEAYKIIWELASLFDLNYLNYYVKIDSVLCFIYWPTHILSLV